MTFLPVSLKASLQRETRLTRRDVSHDAHTDDNSTQAPADSRRSHDSCSPVHEDVDRIAPIVEDATRDGQTQDSNLGTHDSSGAEQQLMSKSTQNVNAAEEPVLPTLRYRRTSLWLLACYLPFLILPWILTNILVHRPPSMPSYYDQRIGYCGWKYTALNFWLAFPRILNSIASILTVPITSALLAHGAVVYTQRHKVRQKINLRQTFALADRGWSDIPILWGAYRENGTGSHYLTLAAGLMLLSVIQAPVQSVMVGYEVIFIMTCADHPAFSPVLGYDPEPKDLAMTPQRLVIPDVIKSLATVTAKDMQAYLWHDTASDWSKFSGAPTDPLGGTFYAPYVLDQSLRYFVSAFPDNTNTGVLREHVMRLNSSAECAVIDETTFPETCNGPDPFVVSYHSQINPPQYENLTGLGNFDIDVCVPGNLSASPWTLSRDRQDIAEDLYIKVHVDYETYVAWGLYDTHPVNFTVHCSANTTRGYFELPNSRNDFIAGPLLEKWPDQETLWNEYNDYLNDGLGSPGAVPSTWDGSSDTDPYAAYYAGDWNLPPDPFYREMRQTPGPLMTSALAMFGKDSFFYVASNSTNSSYPLVTSQICQAGNIPFIRLDGLSGILYDRIYSACFAINDAWYETYEPPPLDPILYEFFATFNPQNEGPIDAQVYSKEALEVAMFFANQHWLTETGTATEILYSARPIFTGPGLAIAHPVVPLYAKITVSILIAFQLLGLGLLVKYIYSVPTWTEKLDSCAIAQLTHGVDHVNIFSTIKKPDEKTLQGLKECNGLIGIAEKHRDDDAGSMSDGQNAAGNVDAVDTISTQSNEEDLHVESASARPNDEVELMIGGAGFVSRRHASFKDWKPKFKRWRRKTTKESMLEKGDK